jgi:hypothetical protein
MTYLFACRAIPLERGWRHQCSDLSALVFFPHRLLVTDLREDIDGIE